MKRLRRGAIAQSVYVLSCVIASVIAITRRVAPHAPNHLSTSPNDFRLRWGARTHRTHRSVARAAHPGRSSRGRYLRRFGACGGARWPRV